MDSSILKTFLHKEVAIKKTDGYTLIGIIDEIADAHILLRNEKHGDRIMLVSDILEIEERRENNG